MKELSLMLHPFHFPQWTDAQPQPELISKGHLVFRRSPAQKTYLAHQYLEHPFHITRPFYLDAAMPEFATLYLQSSSGGIVQGDRLQFQVEVQAGAAVQVTTQAATKVHTMEQGFASQHINIQVKNNGYLEYLIDPLILFPKSRLLSSTQVYLEPDATLILSDSFIIHQSDLSSEPTPDLYANELIIQNFNNQPLAIDRFYFDSQIKLSSLPDFRNPLIPYQAQATIFIICRNSPLKDVLSKLQTRCAGLPNCYVGFSTLPNNCGVWMRLLTEARSLKKSLEICYAACREVVAEQPWTRRRK
ncbi:MAG: urease accessory protein UreD [Elainellaceae cyanobacterium]